MRIGQEDPVAGQGDLGCWIVLLAAEHRVYNTRRLFVIARCIVVVHVEVLPQAGRGELGTMPRLGRRRARMNVGVQSSSCITPAWSINTVTTQMRPL